MEDADRAVKLYEGAVLDLGVGRCGISVRVLIVGVRDVI